MTEELAPLHLEAKPIPPSEYIPDLPVALEENILKVISKEPSARYRTADQLGRVLMKFGTQRDSAVVTSLPVPIPNEPVSEYALPEAPLPATAKIAASEQPLNIDWVAVGLGLLALIAAGGLIPFWMWIYFVYNPPIK